MCFGRGFAPFSLDGYTARIWCPFFFWKNEIVNSSQIHSRTHWGYLLRNSLCIDPIPLKNTSLFSEYHWDAWFLTFGPLVPKVMASSSSIPTDLPLGCLLQNLKCLHHSDIKSPKPIHYSTQVCLKYPPNKLSNWLPKGSLDPSIIQNIYNFENAHKNIKRIL